MRLTFAQKQFRKRLAHGSVIDGARILRDRIQLVERLRAGERKRAA